MTPDSPLTPDSRRNFVKKSLAASILAAQPTILAGLIRAEGGGGGTGTTAPWETTNATTCPNTTYGWETTVPGTTVPETTGIQTTAALKIKTRTFDIKLYVVSVSGDWPNVTYELSVDPDEALPIDLNNHDDVGPWPTPAILNAAAPTLGGFPMVKIDETFISTSAGLRAGYPKLFPNPDAATFQEVVEPMIGNSFRRKGFRMRVYYLWVYQDEEAPAGADEAQHAPES